jgi:hypothetical protein
MKAAGLFAIFGAFVVLTSADKCTPSDYTGVVTCLQDKLGKEWSDLETQKQTKIDADQKIITDCYKSNACTATLKFDNFIDYLPDKVVKDMANLVFELWSESPKAMQACILNDARDLLIEKLTPCIQKTVPDFGLTKLPAIPLPSDNMYKNNKDLLKHYITDRLIAGLALKDCPKDKKVSTARCMTDKSDKTVKQCVKDNICSKAPCKAGFTTTCTALTNCVSDLIKDGKVKISTLQEDSKTKILAFLDKCQTDAQKVDPNYTYSHIKVLKIASLASQVKEQNLDPEFKETVRSVGKAYFSTESLCYNQC